MIGERRIGWCMSLSRLLDNLVTNQRPCRRVIIGGQIRRLR